MVPDNLVAEEEEEDENGFLQMGLFGNTVSVILF